MNSDKLHGPYPTCEGSMSFGLARKINGSCFAVRMLMLCLSLSKGSFVLSTPV